MFKLSTPQKQILKAINRGEEIRRPSLDHANWLYSGKTLNAQSVRKLIALGLAASEERTTGRDPWQYLVITEAGRKQCEFWQAEYAKLTAAPEAEKPVVLRYLNEDYDFPIVTIIERKVEYGNPPANTVYGKVDGFPTPWSRLFEENIAWDASDNALYDAPQPAAPASEPSASEPAGRPRLGDTLISPKAAKIIAEKDAEIARLKDELAEANERAQNAAFWESVYFDTQKTVARIIGNPEELDPFEALTRIYGIYREIVKAGPQKTADKEQS